MAVEQDIRQKLIFANDDWDPEEQPKICTRRWPQSGEPRGDKIGEWAQVIRSALRHAINGQNQASNSGWERKCLTVLAGLRKRNRIATGKGLQKCTTWQKRCTAAKVNLRAVTNRPHQDAWKKKCSTCSLNHKRKQIERSKSTVVSNQYS